MQTTREIRGLYCSVEQPENATTHQPVTEVNLLRFRNVYIILHFLDIKGRLRGKCVFLQNHNRRQLLAAAALASTLGDMPMVRTICVLLALGIDRFCAYLSGLHRCYRGNCTNTPAPVNKPRLTRQTNQLKVDNLITTQQSKATSCAYCTVRQIPDSSSTFFGY